MLKVWGVGPPARPSAATTREESIPPLRSAATWTSAFDWRRGVGERLDGESIAAEEERPAAEIVNGEGEHPLQPGGAVLALFLVQVRQDLRVGGAPESMPPLLEHLAENPVVVDLAVEDD